MTATTTATTTTTYYRGSILHFHADPDTHNDDGDADKYLAATDHVGEQPQRPLRYRAAHDCGGHEPGCHLRDVPDGGGVDIRVDGALVARMKNALGLGPEQVRLVRPPLRRQPRRWRFRRATGSIANWRPG